MRKNIQKNNEDLSERTDSDLLRNNELNFGSYLNG